MTLPCCACVYIRINDTFYSVALSVVRSLGVQSLVSRSWVRIPCRSAVPYHSLFFLYIKKKTLIGVVLNFLAPAVEHCLEQWETFYWLDFGLIRSH